MYRLRLSEAALAKIRWRYFGLIVAIGAFCSVEMGARADLRELRILARSGVNGLSVIGDNIAINREGIIGFTGNDAEGSRAFALRGSNDFTALGITGTSRTYAGVGISSGANYEVLARELVTGPSYVVRKWSVSTGAGTILGSSSSSSGPADFNSATSLLDMNSQAVAAVPALISGSTATVLLIGSTRPMAQAAVYSGAIPLRPQIADTGEAVIRDNTGRIIAWTAAGPTYVPAGISGGFGSDTGNRPGISSDGTAIAFSGNRGAGQGIYVGLRLGGYPPMVVPLAGGELADGFANFPSEQRVGVKAVHGSGVDMITVVFQAASNGVDGVYTRDLTVLNGVAQTLPPARQIIKMGDVLGGATVTGYTLYRPINDDGEIAFTVRLSDASTAIVLWLPVLFGVDVSHHQNEAGAIDWSAVTNAGKKFVVVKASEGRTVRDSFLAANMQGAAGVQLLTAPYHLAHPENNPVPANEATNFLRQAAGYIGSRFLPPVLDLEQTVAQAYVAQNPMGDLSAWVRDWLQYIEQQTCVRPIIYTSRSVLTDYLGDDLASSYGLWIATEDGDPLATPSYQGTSWLDWQFKQYADENNGGVCPGITGAADLDSFHGTLNMLMALRTATCPPRFTGIGGGAVQPPVNGQFHFEITVYGSQQVRVETSDDLVHWGNSTTLTVTGGKASYTDPEAGTHPSRYYRVLP